MFNLPDIRPGNKLASPGLNELLQRLSDQTERNSKTTVEPPLEAIDTPSGTHLRMSRFGIYGQITDITQDDGSYSFQQMIPKGDGTWQLVTDGITGDATIPSNPAYEFNLQTDVSLDTIVWLWKGAEDEWLFDKALDLELGCGLDYNPDTGQIEVNPSDLAGTGLRADPANSVRVPYEPQHCKIELDLEAATVFTIDYLVAVSLAMNGNQLCLTSYSQEVELYESASGNLIGIEGGIIQSNMQCVDMSACCGGSAGSGSGSGISGSGILVHSGTGISIGGGGCNGLCPDVQFLTMAVIGHGACSCISASNVTLAQVSTNEWSGSYTTTCNGPMFCNAGVTVTCTGGVWTMNGSLAGPSYPITATSTTCFPWQVNFTGVANIMECCAGTGSADYIITGGYCCPT